MTHPAPEHLGAYLDGELDADARAAVDAHLDACAECGAHLAGLAAVDEAAREVPLVVPAGYFDDFAPRVRARLEQRAPARWRPPVWGWAAAAALLLGVVTPLALRERSAATVRLDQRVESAHPAAPAASAPASGIGAKQDSEPEAAADAPSGRAAPPREPMLEKRSGAYALPPPPPTTSPVRSEPRTLDEAPKPSVAGRDADARANAVFADRLARRDVVTRDEGAAVGGSAGAPGAPPSTQAAPAQERAKRERDGAAEAKLQRDSFEQAEPQRAAASPVPPAAPAATGQRQYGPRGQNTAEPPPPPAALKAAKAVEPSKDKETANAVTETDTLGATVQESVTVTREPQGFTRGTESMKFRTLQRARPRSDAEARALREEWRTFATRYPDLPEADEARVQLVEAGALAYRLGGKPQDREVALRDGRSYLERPQAPQAERVRALLKTLEPAETR